MSIETKPVYEFGPFRLDSNQYLLLRDGKPLPLTPKALEALLVLVEGHGQVVGKEELMKRLWPETFVEEGNLAFQISNLRKALGDDRRNGNRYIVTVPKRGYRFIAPVTFDHGPGGRVTPATQEPIPGQSKAGPAPIPAATDPRMPRRTPLGRQALLILMGATLIGVAFAVYFLGRPVPAPTVLGYTQITHDGLEKYPEQRMLQDGSLIYFTEMTAAGSVLAQVAASGGEASIVHIPFQACGTFDFSPRTHAALVGICGSGSLAPILVQPLPSGSPHVLGDVRAYDAAWAPDGQTVAYTGQRGVYLVDATGASPRKIAAVPDGASSLRWSPDGKRLRFSVFDAPRSRYSFWEVLSNGSGLREMLHGAPNEYLGDWTPDGKYYVFSLSTDDKHDIWAIRETIPLIRRGNARPVQITHGPMNYWSPVLSADGSKLFVIGWERRGELVRWDSRSNEFIGFLGGISADWVGFSRDGRWVAYLKFPEETLWRMRPDGTEAKQLSFKPMYVAGLEWSPSGTQIAFRAKKPGGSYKIYVVSEQGGEPIELLPKHLDEEGVPTWSPDGKQIAFGDVPAVYGHGKGNEVIHLYNLTTGRLSSLPDSQGLWTCRWSPEGRYVAATTIARRELMLFDLHTGKWRDLSVDHVNNLKWSHDGRYIYLDMDSAEWNSGIFRVRVSDTKRERVAAFNGMRRAHVSWIGVAPDDSPIVLRDIGTQEVYALDVKWP